MKTHYMEAQCQICGELGPATVKTAAAQWIVGNTVVHTDPQICIQNLNKNKK